MNEHKAVIDAYLDDELTERQYHELVTWIRQAPGNVESFITDCYLHSQLRDIFREERIAHDVRALWMSDAKQISDPHPAIADPSVDQSIVGSPNVGFFSTALHTTFGYFSEGMPLAYVLATVIVGVGLLIGSRIYVSGPEQVASGEKGTGPLCQNGPQGALHKADLSPSSRQFVGRITGMVDCQWEKKGTDPIGRNGLEGALHQWGLSPFSPESLPSPGTDRTVGHGRGAGGEGSLQLQSSVHLHDRFALASGLLEITYNSGAKVILQGPVTYEVESRDGGYLSIGKLTAKVEKKGDTNSPLPSDGRGAGGEGGESSLHPSSFILHPLFSVRTPTAVVTDLGTEFGVEVDKQGGTTSHVFRGLVKVQLLGTDVENQNNTVVLHENESVQTKRNLDAAEPSVRLSRVKSDPQVFVRRVDVPVKALDLRDIVAGGDGRWQHRSRNFNPLNGMGDTVLVLGAGTAKKPCRFGSADELIDRLFLPDGNQGAVSLDSAEHVFNGFPKTAGTLSGSIDATATGVPSSNATASNYRGLLGLRSNAGITFDLKAIREAYPGVRPTRFRSSVFCGSSAGVTTLFQDDFQSDTAGTMPRDASLVLVPAVGTGDIGGNWTYAPGNDTLVQLWNNVNPAKPADDAGANNYLKLLDGNGPLTATGWDASATTNGQFELSFSIWKDSTKPGWSGVAGFVDQLENERTFSIYFGSDGIVSYFDGTGMVASGITYQTDTWQNVTMTADMATQTFSLTVGNATVKNLRWAYNTNRVNCVYFGNGGVMPAQCFIDSVKVTAVAGLVESQRRGFGKEGQGDLWVFVDGQLKLNRMKIRPEDAAVPLDIELGPNERFLTLVGIGEANPQPWNWIVFGDPVLEMTSSEDSKPQ